MKTPKGLFRILILMLVLTFSFSACSKDEATIIDPPPCTGNCDGKEEDEKEITGETADKINTLVANLNYDADLLLNVQNTGGTSNSREVLNEDVEPPTIEQGVESGCITTDYSLATNFEDVAILRPTQGIVWPGALVVANSSMLDGLPDPLTLKRAPVTLRVDLPGIGENGTIVVDDPTNSNVLTGIDNALEYWNDNAYQEGYVNAANSSFQTTTSYSSKQMSLDVGLNVEWSSGDVSAQFEYSSSTESRVAMMVFKQVFYTITMDTPEKPASVFSADVSLSDVENKLKSDTPPAYVQSVSYGRIIMFRMETTEESTDAELEAAFNYAGGTVSASGELEAKYKSILSKSSMTVVTIGGNAAVATEAISAKEFGDLEPIITGENAVYSRSNPGVPIAYTMRYLKDNSFAKMGYTTEYTAKNCSSQLIVNNRINYKNDARLWNGNTRTNSSPWPGWARVFMQYKKPNSNEIVETVWSEDLIVGGFTEFDPPAGAHDIRIIQEYFFNCFGCYNGWVDRNQVNLGTTPQETFVESWYDNNSGTMKIYKTAQFED